MPNVVYTFIASDKFTRIADKMAGRTGNLADKMTDLREEALVASGAIDKVTRSLRNTGFGLIAAGAAFSAAQTPFLTQFAELENIQIAFEQIVGSAEKGREVFKDLQDFQQGTPFDLIAIKNAGQTLLTFGTDTKDLRLELTALGNITAASGGSIEDLANVFGKAQTAGRVTQDVINSLAIRGVNVMKIWSEKSGASVDVIRDAVSKGRVPFEALRETILDLGAREGGKFTGIMTEQSKRLTGAWTRFSGAITLSKAALGGVLSEAGKVPQLLNFLENALTKTTKAVIAWTERHPRLTSLIANFGSVLFIAGSILIAFSGVLAVLAGAMLPLLILRFLGLRAVIQAFLFLMPGLRLAVLGLSIAFGTLTAASVLILAALLLIPAVIFIIIRNFKQIKLFFGFLLTDLKEFAGAVVSFVFAPITTFFREMGAAFGFASSGIDDVSAKAGAIPDKLKGLTPGELGGDINIGGGGDFVSRNQSSIDITLNSPRGVIAGVKSKTSGDTGGLNLGVQLQEAL